MDDYYVKEDNPDVVITNYINLDMAGVNWPGGGGAPHGDPDPAIDEEVTRKMRRYGQ